MEHNNQARRGSFQWINVSIIFLLVILGFLMFQILHPQRLKQAVSSKGVVTQSIVLPADPAVESTKKADAVAGVSSQATLISPQAVATGKFTIQVASFQDKARADVVAQALQAAGFAPFVETKDLKDKGIWYRVYTGRLETQAQAQSFLEGVKKVYAGAFVKEL